MKTIAFVVCLFVSSAAFAGDSLRKGEVAPADGVLFIAVVKGQKAPVDGKFMLVSEAAAMADVLEKVKDFAPVLARARAIMTVCQSVVALCRERCPGLDPEIVKALSP